MFGEVEGRVAVDVLGGGLAARAEQQARDHPAADTQMTFRLQES